VQGVNHGGEGRQKSEEALPNQNFLKGRTKAADLGEVRLGPR